MEDTSYKSLSAKEKSSLLNNCYAELDGTYYDKTGNLVIYFV